jgi:tetratricopeptide (TPR) repeat protein
MFSINKPTLAIGLLLILVFSSSVFAASDKAPGPLPEKALMNQQGVTHFKRGYYDMIPRGRKVEAQQEMARAEQAFMRAIEIDPDFTDAHRNLARLYYLQEKYDQAAIEYSHVLRLDPGDIDTYVQMAVVETELGNFEEALNHLEAAKKETEDEQVIQKLDNYIQKITEAQ